MSTNDDGSERSATVIEQNSEMAERLLAVEEGDEVQLSFILDGEESTTRQRVVDVTERGMLTEIYMENCPDWNGPCISLEVLTASVVPEVKTTLKPSMDDPVPVQEFTEMTVETREQVEA